MQPQICFPTTGCWAQLALKIKTLFWHGFNKENYIHLINRLVSSVNGLVRFQAIALSEPCMTNIALVWLFPCVDSDVALQLEGVGAGIGAMGTLVRSLAAMASHVSL